MSAAVKRGGATDALLKAWTDAIEVERRANSKVACAVSLFLAGKIDRAELATYSSAADAATRDRDAAERTYRDSYR